MLRRVRSLADELGVEIGRPSRVNNTRRMIAVAEYARDNELLHPLRHAAMRGYWLEGKNLEDDDDIAQIAGSIGLDPEGAIRASRDPKYLDKVDETRALGMSMGVTGVPTFRFGRYPVVGCQNDELFEWVARRMNAPPRDDSPAV